LVRKKTSIYVDEELWKKFQLRVVEVHGNGRHLSEELEKVIKRWLDSKLI